MNDQNALAPQTITYAEPLRLLPVDEVVRRTGRCKARIYADIRRGTFPAPVHDGKSSRWNSKDVEAWIATLLATQGEEATAP